VLLALGTGVGALAAWRGRQTRTGEVVPKR
jgi:hypothetical protein